MIELDRSSGFLEDALSQSRVHVLGIVKTFDSERGIGIIRGRNGCKYPVTRADVIVVRPLTTGQRVIFSVRFVNNHAFATNVALARLGFRERTT